MFILLKVQTYLISWSVDQVKLNALLRSHKLN